MERPPSAQSSTASPGSARCRNISQRRKTEQGGTRSQQAPPELRPKGRKSLFVYPCPHEAPVHLSGSLVLREESALAMSFGVMDLVAPPPDRCSVSACAWVCDGRVCDEALTMFCLCPGSIAPGKPMSDEEERRVAWLTVSRAMSTRQVSNQCSMTGKGLIGAFRYGQ